MKVVEDVEGRGGSKRVGEDGGEWRSGGLEGVYDSSVAHSSEKKLECPYTAARFAPFM